MNNCYIPRKAKIIDVISETKSNLNIKTFRVKLLEGEMDFKPGQFAEVTVFGVGEAPFCICSSPTQKDFMEFSIKETGFLTGAIHNLAKDDEIGIRGPFGNYFPYERMYGKNLVFVAGGIGLAPLRSLINYVLDDANRNDFGKVEMLLAFRSPEDLVYQWNFKDWESSPDTSITYTIDKPYDGWPHKVGFPHTMLGNMKLLEDPDTFIVTCGPPVMIKFIIQELVKMKISPERIITTLEMRMTCGIGKCGKCNIGHQYVCIDGPVFSLDQLSGMPGEY
ncbi:MAG: FAD/NAD(P)-binding protein [Saccharofermentanales bacterium]